MKELTDEIAKLCAEKYVKEHFKVFESSSQFSHFFVRVGQDLENMPNDIYADSIPVNEMLLTSRKSAITAFYDTCPYQKEFLIQVKVSLQKKKLVSEILRKP